MDWLTILNQLHIGEAIRPKTWGPQCWHFLDCLVFSYPIAPDADEQADMAAYFHALKKMLPCYSCRRDFTQMMEDDPIERHLHCRESLARWLHEKHNRVNRKLGKPEMAFEDYVTTFVQRQPTKSRASTPHSGAPTYPVAGQVNANVASSSPNFLWIAVFLALAFAGGWITSRVVKIK
jgi:hypothetical protein